MFQNTYFIIINKSDLFKKLISMENAQILESYIDSSSIE